MELKDGMKTFYAKTQKEWRKWLEKNHQSEKSVWLIIYKKEATIKIEKNTALYIDNKSKNKVSVELNLKSNSHLSMGYKE